METAGIEVLEKQLTEAQKCEMAIRSHEDLLASWRQKIGIYTISFSEAIFSVSVDEKYQSFIVEILQMQLKELKKKFSEM